MIGFTFFFASTVFAIIASAGAGKKVDYGEGIAMTGFYFALKGDNGAGMA
ncbi:hypothetical protein [Klebsiella pneumoniae IS46]|nr:hypothetical protein [Klebsiella pneumoniae IS46]